MRHVRRVKCDTRPEVTILKVTSLISLDEGMCLLSSRGRSLQVIVDYGEWLGMWFLYRRRGATSCWTSDRASLPCSPPSWRVPLRWLVQVSWRDSKTRQAQSERIWNARKHCYTTILSALKQALEAADVVNRGYNSRDGGLSPHDYFSSPLREAQENKAVEAWTTCEAEFIENHLIVSDDFLVRFKSLQESLPTEYDSVDPPEDASQRAACLREAYRDLLPLARSEMFKRRDTKLVLPGM